MEDQQLKLYGVHQPVSPLHMPLQILGFFARRTIIQTLNTVKVRYFWFISDKHKEPWQPHICVEIRYWKGDHARPVKYNVKIPKQYGRHRNMVDKCITTDPSEAIDFINEEISKCQQQ